MRWRNLIPFMVPLAALAFQTTSAQSGKPKKHRGAEAEQQGAGGGTLSLVPDSAPIFSAESPLRLTITADFRRLRRDRGDDPPWRGGTVAYTGDSGATVRVPVRLRTRGIWRLHNCDFPPLRLDFPKEERRHTVFAKLDRPKLVTHCHDSDRYERLLLQEFQLYRVYRALTPFSHRVRLARVTYVDSGNGKPVATRYAILEEAPEAVARRVGGMLLRQKGGGPSDFDPLQQTVFALFQYLIGNTDWSISALHNVEVVARDTAVVPVAYDFDFSGVIDAPYAVPDPQLHISSVRQRVYRGYCVPPTAYPTAFALFTERKPAIYALYQDSLGTLLDRGDVRHTLEYFDDFYRTITNAGRARGDIVAACLGTW
ncbi:MAG TPA: hypothetical protein VJU87_02485 [Gemmatimonadaceae bacterium]|nr:hypothetical protein [Gemmatimonadaceae bacterium]